MDKSWIYRSKRDPVYLSGVLDFIALANENLENGKTRCPCKACRTGSWFAPETVYDHLLDNGFYTRYDKWVYHEKVDAEHVGGSSRGNTGPHNADELPEIATLLKDAFKAQLAHPGSTTDEPGFEFEYHSHNPTPPATSIEDDPRYQTLLAAAKEDLYEGCSSFSKLSYILQLFQLKCMGNWSGESFTLMLKLFGQAFPHITDFPKSYYEGKKMINDLGLGYVKIDACRNDCCIFWGDNHNLDACPTCEESRWKTSDSSSTGKKKAFKVFRYFPLIPRLRRIYGSTKMAEDMRWHENGRVKDGKLRHPADGKDWIDFDVEYTDFAADPRSVRLGLASDGFNPYRLMSTNYSCWPVILIPYNLPPWLCMKSSSFILSVLIPGKYSPGMDIDVYLQPLVHELKQLWEGVDAFDAYAGEDFKLKASLRWTINDFPAFAMLSGWRTSGYNACPICTNSTPSERFANRICFVGHRKWLPVDHPFRAQASKFYGTVENDTAPERTSGADVLDQQKAVKYVYGKQGDKKIVGKKRGKSQEATTSRKKSKVASQTATDEGSDAGAKKNPVWSKLSIFFDLPYWTFNKLRHNLDMMHIEKNVMENILHTFLGMEKSRDDEASRRAIQAKNLRKDLWVQENGDKIVIPPAPFTMQNDEKDRFLRVIKKIKAPAGYGSNLSRCVNSKQRKLQNLKSHDNHVLMQDLLPPVLRASNTGHKVVDIISELSAFFKYLCSPTLDVKELDDMQERIVLVLCEMEKVWLPTFFTVMVHLLVHLVEEAKLGGPVQYRWMYPIERYLAHLKSHVTNKAQPEGSIAEGYHLEESINFCSKYLEDIESNLGKRKRDLDPANDLDPGKYLFNSGGQVVGSEVVQKMDARSLKQAHRYILIHTLEMDPLLNEFVRNKKEGHVGIVDEALENEWVVKEYCDWLQKQEKNINAEDDVGKLMKALAGGPKVSVKFMKGYIVNGYKFCIVDRDKKLKTQNSGVTLEAEGRTYYGRITHIYEVAYLDSYKVILFRCDWVDLSKGYKVVGNDGVVVNFKWLMHTGRQLSDDPFVISTQVKQVFYIEDEVHKGWLHVVKGKQRDKFDLGEEVDDDQ